MRDCPACKLCFPDDVNNCPIDGDATFFSIPGEPILEGKYLLERRLGQGGMGVDYKARHNFLKTMHAIKVILPDLVGNDPNLVTRFRQEAIASAAVKHQNIVNVTDFGVVGGKMPFIVMEFVKGESLHDMLVREKRLTPQQAFEVMSGIAAGVGAAHKQGIVHRDLKPLNVMLCADKPLTEAVKILDFGLAKIKSGELLGSFIQAQTTGLMGSPYYMAPEQWSDDEPDGRADIYSLGVMLYQMLAGDVPFKGTNIPAIMRKHLYDPPPPFAVIGLELAPEIERVVHHALEKEREQRTESVEQLVAELRQAVGATTGGIHLTDANLMADTLISQSNTTGKVSTGQTTTPPAARTTLRVLTNPPQSKVSLDGKPLGISDANGWLITRDIPRGIHQLKVSNDGFLDSESQINCESEVCQTVVQLRSLLATNVSPITGETPKGFVSSKNNITGTNVGTETSGSNIGLNAGVQGEAPNNVGIRSYPEPTFEKSNIGTKPNTETGDSFTTIDAPIEEKKKNYLLPIAVGVIGFILLVFVGVGFVAVKYLPWGGGNEEPTPSPVASVKPSPASSPGVKPEMVRIEGGTFMMGRNDGANAEQPAHSVQVKSFMMDKTEVTNAEYAQFVAEKGHRAPENWAGNKPLPEELNKPVVFVSLEDARAFAKWRSERDSVQYRLPTEAEWEYAARNGGDATVYPWGNNWIGKRAAVEESAISPVGSVTDGANKWGVQDLIGNVWEWTDTQLKWYPGSKGDPSAIKQNEYIIRGGSFKSNKSGDKAITSSYRQWVDLATRNHLLGFRLVTDVKN